MGIWKWPWEWSGPLSYVLLFKISPSKVRFLSPPLNLTMAICCRNVGQRRFIIMVSTKNISLQKCQCPKFSYQFQRWFGILCINSSSSSRFTRLQQTDQSKFIPTAHISLFSRRDHLGWSIKQFKSCFWYCWKTSGHPENAWCRRYEIPIVDSFLSIDIDMVETIRPDEKCVMTYVSAYYHAFSGVYKVLKKLGVNLPCTHGFPFIPLFIRELVHALHECVCVYVCFCRNQ